MIRPLKKLLEMEMEDGKDENNKFNSDWLRSYSDDFKKRFL